MSGRKSKNKEEWKVIKGFSNYEISSFGVVRRCVDGVTRKKGYHPKGVYSQDGYLRYKLTDDDGVKRLISAHRLVAMNFIGDPPTEKHQCAHNDGVRDNNHYSNLRWATPKENSRDQVKHGTNPIGARNPRSKLNDDLVRKIRKEYTGKYGNTTYLSKKYGVSGTVINYVAKYKSWRHVN